MDATYSVEKQAPKVSVSCNNKTFDGLEAQEVFKKFQTSRSILFHNSPQSELFRLRYREGFGQLRELSGDGAAAVAKLKKDMERGLQKIAKNQQQELEGLLGRLETKYRVGLSVSAFDLGWLPLNLTLGDSKHDVPLDSWGSGTQNRTLILRTLFRAKQISKAETSASKITPSSSSKSRRAFFIRMRKPNLAEYFKIWQKSSRSKFLSPRTALIS